MREPIWWKGIFFRMPGEELARKERRVFVAGLWAEELFRSGRRVFEVWEFVSPDEESFINYRRLRGGEFDRRSIYDQMFNHYIDRVLKELYLKGVREYEEVKREFERAVFDPEWMEVWDRIRELKRDPEWWERMRPRMERLKETGYDTLTAHGKVVAELVFVQTIEGTKEELCGTEEEGGIPEKIADWAYYEKFPEELGREGMEWLERIEKMWIWAHREAGEGEKRLLQVG